MNVRNGTGGSSSHASTRPFAVALSVGLEFHNRDETGGERVSNYCVETKLEADAEFNSLTGDAVYLGPTFFWKIAPKVLMSAAWKLIAGREIGASEPRST
jgi:hypothetical protein